MTPTTTDRPTIRTTDPYSDANLPQFDPLPDGVEVPKPIRAASDAFAEASATHRAAVLAWRKARSEATKLTHADGQARIAAKRDGIPDPDPEGPAARQREAAAHEQASIAHRDLVETAIAFADAMAAARDEGWPAELRDQEREADARIEELLDELDEESRVKHGLAELQRVLSDWTYRVDADVDERWARLRNGGRDAPRLRNVGRVVGELQAERVRQLRFEATRRYVAS